MREKVKIILAFLLFIATLVIPILVGGLVGGYQWINRDAQANFSTVYTTSVIVAISTYLVLFALAVFLLFRAKGLTWIGASLPYLFSIVYSALFVDLVPDITPIVGQIDDGTAMTFGAIFSSLLTLHRNPKTPKWVFLPLVLAAIYTFFGGVFPGQFDELLVQSISFLTFALGINRQISKRQQETSDLG